MATRSGRRRIGRQEKDPRSEETTGGLTKLMCLCQTSEQEMRSVVMYHQRCTCRRPGTHLVSIGARGMLSSFQLEMGLPDCLAIKSRSGSDPPNGVIVVVSPGLH